MASIATIKESTENVACDEQGHATHVFTVTNVSGEELRMGFQALPDAPARGDWFEIAGDNERSFADAATDQVSVTVNLPADAPLGKFTFKLLAFSTVKGRADEDYSEGPIVSFEKPTPAVPVVEPATDDNGGFPWWIVAVAAVVLLIGGAVTAFVLSGNKVPDVAGKTVAEATAAIEQAGLVRGQLVNETAEGIAAGTVLRTDPPEQTKVDEGAEIKLVVVAVPTVAVPTVVRQPLNKAQAILRKAGLEPGSVSAVSVRGFANGTVVRTIPAAGAKIPKGSTVGIHFHLLGIPPAKVVLLKQTQLKAILSRGISERSVNPAADLGLVTDEDSQRSNSTDSQ